MRLINITISILFVSGALLSFNNCEKFDSTSETSRVEILKNRALNFGGSTVGNGMGGSTVGNGKASDFNKDGLVNEADYILMATCTGAVAGLSGNGVDPELCRPADLNQDSLTDRQDTDVFLNDFSPSEGPSVIADFNGDGRVDEDDYGFFIGCTKKKFAPKVCAKLQLDVEGTEEFLESALLAEFKDSPSSEVSVVDFNGDGLINEHDVNFFYSCMGITAPQGTPCHQANQVDESLSYGANPTTYDDLKYLDPDFVGAGDFWFFYDEYERVRGRPLVNWRDVFKPNASKTRE